MAEEKNTPVVETEENTNELRKIRVDKLVALQQAGKDPFQITTAEQSATSAKITAAFEKLEAETNELPEDQRPEQVRIEDVTLCGRIMTWRDMGKANFIDITDRAGRMQVYVRMNDIGEDEFAEFKKWDIGDIIEVKGFVFRTRRGQISVHAQNVRLLSKSLLPLPEKFHGLKDTDTRYRQRYLDLIVNPDVKTTFYKRSLIIKKIRNFLDEKNFVEVETPILVSNAGGAAARPFVTHHNSLNEDFKLRISLELYLKRLIIGGMERVYEIGRVFRNEGMDLTHNPEFTTMEAYRAFSDLEGMKALAQGVIKAANKAIGNPEVIEYQGQTIDLSGEWASRPMTDVVSDVLGKQVTIDTPVEELAAAAREKGLEIKPEWTAGKIIAEIYDELGEDTIVNPTFVCDYPIEVSPLAKRFEDDPRLTHRFELVIAGHEYANAFSELNDPVDQAERFAAQMAEKAGGDDEAMEYDEDYVRALEYGMPPAGGIGIGIDRVVMLLTNQASIRDVLLFPHMKPEKGFQSGAAAAKAAEAGNAASPFVKSLKPTLDYSKIAVEPLFEEFVDFDTFSKSDFRAVKVKACEAVKKSKKLLNFTLDDGTGTDRTILSGIHDYYEPEDLVGKTLLAITNLPPRKMMGIPSCGMLISAVHKEHGEEKLHLMIIDDSVPAGAKLC